MAQDQSRGEGWLQGGIQEQFWCIFHIPIPISKGLSIPYFGTDTLPSSLAIPHLNVWERDYWRRCDGS